jgi:hypothetical protein
MKTCEISLERIRLEQVKSKFLERQKTPAKRQITKDEYEEMQRSLPRNTQYICLAMS